MTGGRKRKSEEAHQVRFTKDEIKAIMGLVVFIWCTIFIILVVTVLDITHGRFPLLFTFVASVWVILRIQNKRALRKTLKEE
jgi:hypothetical protein